MQANTARRLVHFLLIEDDNDHADLVLRSFESNNIVNTIDRVADGLKALDYLNQVGDYSHVVIPDVIILDLNLPRISGLDMLERIKNDDKFRKIPVVVMTTSSNKSDKDRAYAHHVNSYLTKPMDFEKFQMMIQDLNMYWSVWNNSASD